MINIVTVNFKKINSTNSIIGKWIRDTSKGRVFKQVYAHEKGIACYLFIEPDDAKAFKKEWVD